MKLQHTNNLNESKRTIEVIPDKSFLEASVRKDLVNNTIEESKVSTARKGENRKRMITDGNRY